MSCTLCFIFSFSFFFFGGGGTKIFLKILGGYENIFGNFGGYENIFVSFGGVRKYFGEFWGGTKIFPASVKNPHTPYLPSKVSTPNVTQMYKIESHRDLMPGEVTIDPRDILYQ